MTLFFFFSIKIFPQLFLFYSCNVLFSKPFPNTQSHANDSSQGIGSRAPSKFLIQSGEAPAQPCAHLPVDSHLSVTVAPEHRDCSVNTCYTTLSRDWCQEKVCTLENIFSPQSADCAGEEGGSVDGVNHTGEHAPLPFSLVFIALIFHLVLGLFVFFLNYTYFTL